MNARAANGSRTGAGSISHSSIVRGLLKPSRFRRSSSSRLISARVIVHHYTKLRARPDRAKRLISAVPPPPTRARVRNALPLRGAAIPRATHEIGTLSRAGARDSLRHAGHAAAPSGASVAESRGAAPLKRAVRDAQRTTPLGASVPRATDFSDTRPAKFLRCFFELCCEADWRDAAQRCSRGAVQLRCGRAG